MPTRHIAKTSLLAIAMAGLLGAQFHIKPKSERTPKATAPASSAPASSEPGSSQPAVPTAPQPADPPVENTEAPIAKPADPPPAQPATPATATQPATPAKAAAAPSAVPPPQASPEPTAPHHDYYQLALSWAPNYCASAEGVADRRECDPRRHPAFTVHGLWPAALDGHDPRNCGAAKPPSGAVVNMILPYMPSPALIRRDWDERGTCTGLSAAEYFLAVREARASVQIPVQVTALTEETHESPRQVEAQFQSANSSFPKGAFRAACRSGELTEVLVCFDLKNKPMACPPHPAECAAPAVLLRPLR